MHWERVLVWTLTAALVFLWTLYNRRFTIEAARRHREQSRRKD